MSLSTVRVRIALTLSCGAAVSLQGLEFNFTPSGVVPSEVMAAAVEAGNLWKGYFNDPITINIAIAYDSTSGVANTVPNLALFSYSSVTARLGTDARSTDDFSVVANLQPGSSAQFMVNRGFLVPEPSLRVDTGTTGNNAEVMVLNANAKALGLIAGDLTGIDATITLNSSFSYDYDRSNGIGLTQYDAVGIFAHEIGHAMGMYSRAELISTAGANTPDSSFYPAVADLLRFSAESIGSAGGYAGAGPGVFDVSADDRVKYFSVDGGATLITEFARGSNLSFGDGQQANHWRFSLIPAGIMDPTVAEGELLVISPIDVRFFDAIGFDPIPEAGTWAAGLTAVAALFGRRLKRA